MRIERENLKPCPFCGDDHCEVVVDMTKKPERRHYFVECRICDGRMGPQPSEDEVVESWNRRA